MFSLAGKKALIVGIANEDSIAFGCAKALRARCAELAIIFQDHRTEPFGIDNVGAYAAFLASAKAANVTGGIHYIDGGYHIVG